METVSDGLVRLDRIVRIEEELGDLLIYTPDREKGMCVKQGIPDGHEHAELVELANLVNTAHHRLDSNGGVLTADSEFKWVFMPF